MVSEDDESKPGADRADHPNGELEGGPDTIFVEARPWLALSVRPYFGKGGLKLPVVRNFYWHWLETHGFLHHHSPQSGHLAAQYQAHRLFLGRM